MALRAEVDVALCLVELRGFEPLTPCMPLTSQPLAPQHTATRSHTSLLLSRRIRCKRDIAAHSYVRHLLLADCWQTRSSAPLEHLGIGLTEAR
jgi:hypothetical protein